MHTHYKAIFFDLGFTLVDLPHASGIRLRIQESFGQEVFEKIRTLFLAWHTETWTIDEFIARIATITPVDETQRSLLAAWGTNVDLIPYPETISVLKELKARDYKIAVVSNAPPIHPETLQNLGLHAYVDAWIFSCDVGANKPDPIVFQAALARVGVQPGEALMVGDSLEKDVEGAIAAGIDAIQIVRPGTVSDYTNQITNLNELLERL